jgi:hypothetical protein
VEGEFFDPTVPYIDEDNFDSKKRTPKKINTEFGPTSTNTHAGTKSRSVNMMNHHSNKGSGRFDTLTREAEDLMASGKAAIMTAVNERKRRLISGLPSGSEHPENIAGVGCADLVADEVLSPDSFQIRHTAAVSAAFATPRPAPPSRWQSVTNPNAHPKPRSTAAQPLRGVGSSLDPAAIPSTKVESQAGGLTDRLRDQEAAVEAELRQCVQARPELPSPAPSPIIALLDVQGHPDVRERPIHGSKAIVASPRTNRPGSGLELSVESLPGRQIRPGVAMNFRDDPKVLDELLAQDDDRLDRKAPRGGWIRWSKAQVRFIGTVFLLPANCALTKIDAFWVLLSLLQH